MQAISGHTPLLWWYSACLSINIKSEGLRGTYKGQRSFSFPNTNDNLITVFCMMSPQVVLINLTGSNGSFLLTHLQLRYDKQDVNYRDITPIFVGLWRNQKISVRQKTYCGVSRGVAAQLSKHVAPHCDVLYQLKDEAEFSPADQPVCMRVRSSKHVHVRVATCRQESLTPSATLERNN